MDLTISLCNKFIISAGKDCRILIWDLKHLQLLQDLNHHTKQVNSIKLVMIGKRQILFSCGDDGYVSIFDVNAIKAIGETDIDH